MSTAFSWCDLLHRLQTDLASGSFGAVQSYTISTAGGTRSFSYRSKDELFALMERAMDECALEQGRRPYAGRTYAGNGGRG